MLGDGLLSRTERQLLAFDFGSFVCSGAVLQTTTVLHHQICATAYLILEVIPQKAVVWIQLSALFSGGDAQDGSKQAQVRRLRSRSPHCPAVVLPLATLSSTYTHACRMQCLSVTYAEASRPFVQVGRGLRE